VKLIKPNFWRTNNLISYLLLPLNIITNLAIFFKKNQKIYSPKINSICVGNIYLGGTGKTPLVMKIDEILKKKFKTFVIKKYYINQVDEHRLLEKKTRLILPKKRINGIFKIENSKKNIAIFDDGLQDKSIKYTVSIVCFSSCVGVGNGRLLPAGPLRENLIELKNYNAAFINGKKNTYLEKLIKSYNKNLKIIRGKYILKNKRNFDTKSNYLAFCGIGTPENFFELLKDNNIKVKNKLIFPDHYNYSFNDIEKIKELSLKKNLKIITTEKDYVKLNKFKNIGIKIAKISLHIFKKNDFKKFLINKL